MRSIWKGSVSFGLVSIGVKLYSATEERDVSFHQVRRSDGSRIRYKRVAEADGEEVAYADIAKGYSLDDGEVVVLTDEDFADLPLPTARVVDVLQFVPLEQIDPIYFAKSYYLEPESSAVKPYVLLREALEDSGMVGVVKVALRNREQLALLRVRDDVIVLETMIWPDEVRDADFAFLDDDMTVRPQEAAMAKSLVASMAGDFDASEYTDEYRAALQAVIDAKVEGREVVEAERAGDLGRRRGGRSDGRAARFGRRGQARPVRRAAPTRRPRQTVTRPSKTAKAVKAVKAPAKAAKAVGPTSASSSAKAGRRRRRPRPAAPAKKAAGTAAKRSVKPVRAVKSA